MEIAICVAGLIVAMIWWNREPEYMRRPCRARCASWDANGRKMYDFTFTAKNPREASKRLGREHAIRTIEWNNKHRGR